MTRIEPQYFPESINQYVPNAQYVAEVTHGEESQISLGSPAVADTDGIMDDVAANDTIQSHTSAQFVSTFTGELDATYGRNITMVGTSGSDHVVTVTGRDYLGQLMTETFTLSGTVAQVGDKAFKFITTVGVAVGAAGDTFDVGFGSKLGLPYKIGKMNYSFEGGVKTLDHAEKFEIAGVFADLSTGAAVVSTTAPFDGVILGITGTITTGVTTTLAILDAIVDGTGVPVLDTSVPIGAVGIIWGKLESPANGTTVATGDVVTFTSNDGPAAGASDAIVTYSRPVAEITTPDTTDPATASTGDTRGTYTSSATLDGSTEILVIAQWDGSANSSDNGGLYGITQV